MNKQAAKDFVERWKSLDGNEDRESRSFWIELCQNVLGLDNPTTFLDFEKRAYDEKTTRKIDVFYEDMKILIEQKSRGVDLDKRSVRSKEAGEETPYEQAKWYADHLRYSIRPRWIIVSNFDEFRFHDLDSDDPEKYISVTLDELPDHLSLFRIFSDFSNSRLVKEKELSVKAGEIVGKLYKSLSAQYKNIDTDKEEQRSLNILIVRFVFLLYAEDAEILQKRDAFLDYLRNVEPGDMRSKLIKLFEVLDTPEDERDSYLEDDLAAFPYINGSLFSEQNIIVPQFTPQIKTDLLLNASQEFDWSGISPTIFGAVFESTLNPETRREGGMHYTSIENIHKVIDPLFLDSLKEELTQIENEKSAKNRKIRLEHFQLKLASIKILDPACGSGNFLTESYLSLRKLENRVLEDLQGDQMGLGLTGSDVDPIKVSIDQFYGIEINDFAVSVAKTALWIAEEQMMDATQEIIHAAMNFFPLTSVENIRQGNALRIDWNDIIPASECNYIIGNPPFLGSSVRSSTQTEDLEQVFGDEKKWGKCDYCVGWYVKSADYMYCTNIKAALVSTNSITQGEQVQPTWKRLFDKGIHIIFAWTTFIWNSEATDQAHVHCVIIGFSYLNPKIKYIFMEDGQIAEASNINGYLIDAENIFLPTRTPAVDNKHKNIVQGSKPVDGGGLLFKPDEYESFIKEHPDLIDLFKLYIGSDEFIKGKKRYCLWLKDIDPARYTDNPIIKERLDIVQEKRASSPTAEFREYADRPHLFVQDRAPEDNFLILPRVSSERREYVPFGYLTKEVVPPDSAYIIPNAEIYDFGLLTSKMHNAWIHIVAGRLESRYRYSPVVYNTFIYPSSTPEQKQKIETLAQNILDIRDSYPDKSLADLYDPDKMPSDLLEAHKSLDRAVEEAYGVNFDGDEEKIVSHLFKLYAEATKE